MKTKLRTILLPLILLACSEPESVFAQGSLNPPGPPAPMFRTLEEVQPRVPIGTNTTPGDNGVLFRITQPGSYYLTSNITVAAAKDGIQIAASGVTLDLMGFGLVGPSLQFGITIPQVGTFSNIVIRNGRLESWFTAIDAGNASSSQYRDLRISGSSSIGVKAGVSCTLVSCLVNGNGDGISARGGSLITGCTAHQNSNTGITVEKNARVIDSTSFLNGADGIFGTDGCIISGCVAAQNRRFGIFVQSDSTVTACISDHNDSTGIHANGGSIIACTANGNGGSGIEAGSGCRVADNLCYNNGFGAVKGSGIAVIQDNNRIENNHVVHNQNSGIQVAATGNLIIRNSASGNGTNYFILSGNKVGVIENPPNSGAISGDTGGAGVGTTDPWANFAF